MDDQSQSSDSDVIDVTPIEENSSTDVVSAAPTGSQAEILLNMESMIRNHLSALSKLKEEMTKQKEMLDDILANDPTYQEHLSLANEATKVKNATKAQVLKQPQAADLDKKIKDLKVEMKENQGSLSDYLSEYSRMSGLTEIEDDEGNILEIAFNAKLVRRGSAH